MTISPETIDGFASYSLSNGLVRLVVVPELGGKIISMCRLETGYEWFLQGKRLDHPMTAPRPGSNFEEHGPSGFDECFPTIKACVYTAGEHRGVLLPDHGELWSSPWEVVSMQPAFTLAARGTALPYRFSKSITLCDSTVRFHYELENTSGSPFQYLWSAHPLLRVNEGDRIVLPEDLKTVRVEHSNSDRLGTHGADCGWPIAKTTGGVCRDLSVIHAADSGWAEKLFTPRLSAGSLAIQSPLQSESLTFNFDPAEVPFAGIWINEGGSFVKQSDEDLTVALEPCLAPFDSLAEAITAKEAPVIGPGEAKKWSFEISLAPFSRTAA